MNGIFYDHNHVITLFILLNVFLLFFCFMIISYRYISGEIVGKYY